MKKPLVLVIMDGFGISQSGEKSAITSETAPNLSKFFKIYPTTKLEASGEAVGLPMGQMGNSEVGHMNIGAGRVIFQSSAKITKCINNSSFYENSSLKKAFLSAQKNSSAVHFIGLLSDGGVHSHIEHLFALLRMVRKINVKNVYVHAFLDGRDTSPKSGVNFLKICENYMKELEIGRISTIMGRYYAMDRDNRWKRTKIAYDALVDGIGVYVSNPIESLKNAYKSGVTDEFVKPMIFDKSSTINSGDSIVFFNFRSDRARQITQALVDENFDKFFRKKELRNLNFVSLTNYDENFLNVDMAFKPEKIEDTLSEVLAKNKLTQLKIAETEKYAHITFFLNGGVESKFDSEDRILISSPEVSTYNLKPEMSALKLTKVVKNAISEKKYDVIIVNFANCDMVGHTGDFEATKIAVKTVDKCVNEIVREVLNAEGCTLITADHGNAEKMFDEKGEIFTAHTTNPVPFCIVGQNCKLKSIGKLADIAPTILEMLNLPKINNMTGQSLIEHF